MSVSRILLVFVRAAMAVQVILGIGFWTGNWTSLVSVHMVIGVLFVIALWVIAGIAAANRRPGGLVAFGFIWGVVVVALGMTQKGILIGDLHWIIRVLHLAVGIAAMPIAERLVGGREVAAVRA